MLAQPSKHEFYQDVSVLAFPQPQSTGVVPGQVLCELTASSTHASSDSMFAMDGDLSTYWVSEGPLNPVSPPSLLLELTESTEVSAISW